MEWIVLLSALASVISAALAWAAKLWWSKEYIAAKDEIIKAKETQIDLLNAQIRNLQDLTPMKIREYFLSVRTQLEEYNESLQTELSQARKQIEEKQQEIKSLRAEDNNYKMAELQSRRKELLVKFELLRSELEQVSKLTDSVEVSSELSFIHGASIKGTLRHFVESDLKKRSAEKEALALQAPDVTKALAQRVSHWITSYNHNTSIHRELLLNWLVFDRGAKYVSKDYGVFTVLAEELSNMGYETVPPPSEGVFQLKIWEFEEREKR